MPKQLQAPALGSVNYTAQELRISPGVTTIASGATWESIPLNVLNSRALLATFQLAWTAVSSFDVGIVLYDAAGNKLANGNAGTVPMFLVGSNMAAVDANGSLAIGIGCENPLFMNLAPADGGGADSQLISWVYGALPQIGLTLTNNGANAVTFNTANILVVRA